MAFLDRNPEKNKHRDYPKSGQSNKPFRYSSGLGKEKYDMEVS
jgi:hypothetical protein